MSSNKLDSSIPANNEKIIELYQKVKTGQLNTSPEFQRKLVWKRQHKYNFIDTILHNYPFPEVYKAPGSLNVETLMLTDLIVDGQQRINAIINFIDGTDVFALPTSPLSFTELSKPHKEAFLNYEVSIRYLKNASKAQIKEIFQRINNTEYSLNKMERLNAQWGDSEFVCFAKQLIEDELAIDPNMLSFKVSDANRKLFLDFFHGKAIFTENDNNRMLSLQYILTLLTTIIKGVYFRRNDEVQQYIEIYNDEFDVAAEVEDRLLKVFSAINKLNIVNESWWFNKANTFTLITELYKYDLDCIDLTILSAKLINFEANYNSYIKNNESVTDPNYVTYFQYSREAVNEKAARDHRGLIIKGFIEESISR